MPQSPEYKGCGSSVPKSRCQEHNAQIYDPSHFSFPVAAKGNIEIFSEPCPQCDVPPSPELTDGTRKVRIVKVFGNGKSEHFSKADRHIGITGKIIVNLKGVENGRHPDHTACGVVDIQRKNLIHASTKSIGQNHLFTESITEKPDALRCLLPIGGTVRKFFHAGVILSNRPGYQSGEE